MCIWRPTCAKTAIGPTFSTRSRAGRSEDIDNYIPINNIRVVGIGCMTCEFQDAGERKPGGSKGVHPGITVVLAARHPSGALEECLESGVADYVVVGEGEIALTELLTAIEAKQEPENIPGLWSIERA